MSNINSSGNMTPEQLMKLAASFGGKDAADPEKAINAVSKQLSDEKRPKFSATNRLSKSCFRAPKHSG